MKMEEEKYTYIITKIMKKCRGKLKIHKKLIKLTITKINKYLQY